MTAKRPKQKKHIIIKYIYIIILYIYFIYYTQQALLNHKNKTLIWQQRITSHNTK